MVEVERSAPVRPGEAAPDFTLPSAQHEGSVSLASFRGERAVLLALYRGLYCPFCRRHVAQLDAARARFQEVGIEPIAVFAAPPERARLYFRLRGLGVAVAADEELRTHRAYGLPNLPITPELMRVVGDKAVAMARELGVEPPPDPAGALAAASRAYAGYELQQADIDDLQRHRAQVLGQFMIDARGIVRWARVEGDQASGQGLISYPSPDELIAAARHLSTPPVAGGP